MLHEKVLVIGGGGTQYQLTSHLRDDAIVVAVEEEGCGLWLTLMLLLLLLHFGQCGLEAGSDEHAAQNARRAMLLLVVEIAQVGDQLFVHFSG